MKAEIIYYSSTGNTETMAGLICDAAKEAGVQANLAEAGSAQITEALAADVLILGCPAMGDEELDDGEMEPFFSSIEEKLAGRKVALFGSYDWGDGAWMRKWYARCKEAGADMIQSEGLIANLEPDDEAAASCRALGTLLADL